MSTNNESKSPGHDAKEYIEKFLSTESVGKVFDAMNLGAVLLARDFTVIYVNEAICRILAVSKDKIMNKNILSLFKKDEERELAKEILSLRTKGVSSKGRNVRGNLRILHGYYEKEKHGKGARAAQVLQ